MYICSYCGKEFEKSQSYAAHMSNCKSNPNLKRNFEHDKCSKYSKTASETRIKNNPYKYELKEFHLNCLCCNKEYILKLTQYKYDKGNYRKYCCKSCANSNRKKSEKTKQKISDSIKKYIETNRTLGFIQKDNKIKLRVCEFCGKEFMPKVSINKNGKKIISHAKTCSTECRNNLLSLKNKLAGNGGFREGSVKNYKSGWFNGIHCDSSWELAFLIWHRDNNICVERCKDIRTYILNEIEYKYYPDFIIDNIIYEIKGIDDDVSKAKQYYNPDIKFLYKSDMKKYIDYATSKYGNFINLYDIKDKNVNNNN